MTYKSQNSGGIILFYRKSNIGKLMSQYPKAYLYRRIVLAKLFIDDHYSQDIDLGNIAGKAFFSKFHFIRTFKSIYGKTPHQYLTFVRIEEAKVLLAKGTRVSEVCYSIGFQSESSFTALFERLTGQTPSLYRSAQLKKRNEIVSAPLKHVPNCFAEKYGWAKNSNFQEITV